MKLLIKVLLILIGLSCINNVVASSAEDDKIVEPEMALGPREGQLGGRFITSLTTGGTFVRVMVVFVEFADDNWNPTFAEWPHGQPPTYMGMQFIDNLVTQNSTNQNFTHYYRVMSQNNFVVIGNCFYRMTSRTRDEYITSGLDRADINREIIENIDMTETMSIYDNWNYIADYNNIQGSDNEIDMIWMIYRNIGEDTANPDSVAWELGFGERYTDPITQEINYRQWSGEASLGYGAMFQVDGTINIDMGYWTAGSGLTVMEGYLGLNRVRNIIIHEFGHHLMGGVAEHTVPGFWGMMSGYASRSYMVNSYERNALIWTTPIKYSDNTHNPITLEDYITTGDVLRIDIPGANEYYLLENHQRLSPFDQVDYTGSGEGIFVLHQTGTRNLDLYMIAADGRHEWALDHMIPNPYGGDNLIPVFSKGLPDAINGNFDTDRINYVDPNTGRNTNSPIEAYVHPITGVDVVYPLFRGDASDSFRPEHVEVFSEWSNPRALDENNNPVHIAFHVIEESGQLKVNQYVTPGTQTETPPAIPQNLQVSANIDSEAVLTWDANTEPDIINGGQYKIYLSEVWGTGDPVNWDLVATIDAYISGNPVTTWTHEESLVYIGPRWLHYKLVAVDNTQKESLPSEIASINGRIPKESIEENISKATISYNMSANYPNPFNPSTTISYSLPANGHVQIKVYDILGEEVTELFNGTKAAGQHNIVFNDGELSSGMYIVNMSVNGSDGKTFNQSRKILLMK